MINWNDITSFDIKNVELPKFDMPKFELPKFDMPKLSTPEFDLPADVARVTEFARDAAYAGIGAVVITVQKADERRRELADQVTAQVRKLVDAVA